VGQVAHKGCERRLLCTTKIEEHFKERNYCRTDREEKENF
jgi:hypothetical protein